MRKLLIFLAALSLMNGIVFAKCSSCGTPHHGNCHHHPHSSSSSDSHPVYLIRTENHTDEVKFANCSKHYAITETTTNIYSDGSRRSFANSTIYNSDGTILETDCKSIKHAIYDNKHYFIIRKNDGYKIIDESANVITNRNYSYMSELGPNRLLVKYDKKYGIIDLTDKVVVPIKYQRLEKVTNKIMIAKLNGYYGIIDLDNEIKIAPDCDKIKPLYDTLLLKRYNKYGLMNLEGEYILNIQYDKIKKLGEYIIIKKDGKYGALNYKGDVIGETIYKKIKLKRNKLMGITSREKPAVILNTIYN